MKFEIIFLVPIGFIYVQLPDKQGPQNLWPELAWKDVSERYSGLFFRVVGNGSDEFGNIQKESYKTFRNFNYNWMYTTYRDIEKNTGTFRFIPALKAYGDVIVPPILPRREFETLNDKMSKKNDDTPVGFYILHFRFTKDETHPKNTAIKIWERVA